MLVVYGVDPGVSGAVSVIVDGRLDHVFDVPAMPQPSGKGNRVQAAMLAEHVRDAQARWPMSTAEHVAVIEHVSAMPTDGGPQAFAFGHAAGAIEGVMAALGVAVELVTPAKWKADMGLSVSRGRADPYETPEARKKRKAAEKRLAKEASRGMAARFYPAHAGSFARVCDDGRAEAVLLARWYSTRRGGDAA